MMNTTEWLVVVLLEVKKDSCNGQGVHLTNISYDGSVSQTLSSDVTDADHRYDGVKFCGDKTATVKTDVTEDSSFAYAYATTSVNSRSGVQGNDVKVDCSSCVVIMPAVPQYSDVCIVCLCACTHTHTHQNVLQIFFFYLG